MRKVVIAARRSYQRAGRRSAAVSRDAELSTYRRAKAEFKLAIKRAQEKCWKELCQSVDTDPWGVPYRLVTKRLGRRAPAMDGDLVDSVVRGLFPSPPPADWDDIPLAVAEQPVVDVSSYDAPLVPPITIAEIGHAVTILPSGKAPGLDLVPNEIIKLVFRRYPEVFSEYYNVCS